MPQSATHHTQLTSNAPPSFIPFQPTHAAQMPLQPIVQHGYVHHQHQQPHQGYANIMQGYAAGQDTANSGWPYGQPQAASWPPPQPMQQQHGYAPQLLQQYSQQDHGMPQPAGVAGQAAPQQARGGKAGSPAKQPSPPAHLKARKGAYAQAHTQASSSAQHRKGAQYSEQGQVLASEYSAAAYNGWGHAQPGHGMPHHAAGGAYGNGQQYTNGQYGYEGYSNGQYDGMPYGGASYGTGGDEYGGGSGGRGGDAGGGRDADIPFSRARPVDYQPYDMKVSVTYTGTHTRALYADTHTHTTHTRWTLALALCPRLRGLPVSSLVCVCHVCVCVCMYRTLRTRHTT